MEKTAGIGKICGEYNCFMKRKKSLKKVLIEGMRRMDGVRRWEIVSEKWGMAREFSELGRKYYGTKRSA